MPPHGRVRPDRARRPECRDKAHRRETTATARHGRQRKPVRGRRSRCRDWREAEAHWSSDRSAGSRRRPLRVQRRCGSLAPRSPHPRKGASALQRARTGRPLGAIGSFARDLRVRTKAARRGARGPGARRRLELRSAIRFSKPPKPLRRQHPRPPCREALRAPVAQRGSWRRRLHHHRGAIAARCTAPSTCAVITSQPIDGSTTHSALMSPSPADHDRWTPVKLASAPRPSPLIMSNA